MEVRSAASGPAGAPHGRARVVTAAPRQAAAKHSSAKSVDERTSQLHGKRRRRRIRRGRRSGELSQPLVANASARARSGGAIDVEEQARRVAERTRRHRRGSVRTSGRRASRLVRRRSSAPSAASIHGRHAGVYAAQNGSEPSSLSGIAANALVDRAIANRWRRGGRHEGHVPRGEQNRLLRMVERRVDADQASARRHASATTGTPGSQSAASGAPVIRMRSETAPRSASATRSMMRRPPTVCSPFGSPPKRLFAPPAMIAPISRAVLATESTLASCYSS